MSASSWLLGACAAVICSSREWWVGLASCELLMSQWWMPSPRQPHTTYTTQPQIYWQTLKVVANISHLSDIGAGKEFKEILHLDMSRGLSEPTCNGLPRVFTWPGTKSSLRNLARVGRMGKLKPISLTSKLWCTTQMGLSEGRFSKIKCNFHKKELFSTSTLILFNRESGSNSIECCCINIYFHWYW